LSIALYHGNDRSVWSPPGDPALSMLTTALDATGLTAVAINLGDQIFLRTGDRPWAFALPAGPRVSNAVPPPSSPRGLIAVGTLQLQILNLKTREQILLAPLRAPMTCVKFSHDGRRLAATLVDGSVAVWSQDESPTVRNLPVSTTNPAVGVCFSPDDALLAV